MTNTVLKAQIDSQITNETLSNSISPADVGGNLKAVVDYVGRNEYSFLITQTGTSAPIENAVLINNSGLTFTMVRTDIGRYEIIPNVAQNQDKVGFSISQPRGIGDFATIYYSTDRFIIQTSTSVIGDVPTEFDGRLSRNTVNLYFYE